MEYFTDENIVEPIMRVYKDFKYTEYILNLPFESGFKLYLKALDVIKAEKEKEAKDHVRQMWLLEVQGGCELSFEDYYNLKLKVAESNSLSRDSKISEEKRIIDMIEKKNEKKMKEVKIAL